MIKLIAWAGRHWLLTTVLVLVATSWAMASGSGTAEDPTAGNTSERTATDADGTDDEPAGMTDTDADEEAAPARRAASSTTSPSRKPPPATKQPRPSRPLHRVVDVVDGDTVKIDYRGTVESVRVVGIDSPETRHPSEPDECWGARSSAAAARLLVGKRVALVVDPTQGRRDAFDRLLGYLDVPGAGDFGLRMIRAGHAVEYTYDDAYQRQAQYRRAEQEARGSGRGLWPACGGADKPLRTPAPKSEPRPFAQQPARRCEPGYDPCVPPYPPDVDCPDVDGPIQVTGEDPHGLDRDGDGTACES